MNYYERHIGDYLRDTAHLSLLEHGIYTRLMDVYYTREGPLPAAGVARLIGAKTKDELAAMKVVLAEFFCLVDETYAQDRCDREIARFQEGEPEREVKKANETNRMKKFREERAALFKALTYAGQHAAWNITMNELRDLVKRLPATRPATPATEPATEPITPPATAPATPATATHTHSPLPTPQSPDKGEEPNGSSPSRARTVTPAGAICKRLRAEGIANVNPGNQALLTLIEAGATEDEFAAFAAKALSASDPFAYLLGAVAGERKRAADLAGSIHRGPMPANAKPTAADRRASTIAGLTGQHQPQGAIDERNRNAVDVESRVVQDARIAAA